MAIGKKALIVGVDHYKNFNSLFGCVNDARSVKNVIERNDNDKKLNFATQLIEAKGPKSALTKDTLKNAVIELFKEEKETVLFYFAGHGYIDRFGGYLATSEISSGNDGFAMSELIQIANNSPVKNKLIILDCCHSGIAGSIPDLDGKALLAEGVTILTASGANQYASEKDGAGLFTSLLVDALEGGAANILGHVTPGSIYAYIDQSLGDFKQRPLFKTNVRNFIILKTVSPKLPLDDIHRIVEFFKKKTFIFPLNPSFEPTSTNKKKKNTEKFAVLQKFNGVNLVVPVNEEHMYYAAMNSESCKLTALGHHYWNLVNENLI